MRGCLRCVDLSGVVACMFFCAGLIMSTSLLSEHSKIALVEALKRDIAISHFIGKDSACGAVAFAILQDLGGMMGAW